MWTCPKCGISVRVPDSSRRVTCACGHVFDRQDGGWALVRIGVAQRLSPRGPGTQLAAMLGRCSGCAYAATMDQWGPDACLEQLDTIVGWMMEDGDKRGTPISEAAARRMATLAIERSRATIESLADKAQVSEDECSEASRITAGANDNLTAIDRRKTAKDQ